MSQYFFYTCQSDGKEIISFTYPPSLSTFSEMIERKMALYTKEQLDHEDAYNFFFSLVEKKKYNLNNELISRIKILEKEKRYPSVNILEKRIRLCNDEKGQEYPPKIYDPLWNGPYRGIIKKLHSHTIMNDLINYTKDSIEIFWINKIYELLSISKNSQELEHQINPFEKKSSLNNIINSLTSIDEFSFESIPDFDSKKHSLLTEERKMDSAENKAKSLKLVFDIIKTDPNDRITTRKKYIGIEEMSKKVSRWSYKLTDDLEEQEEENEEEPTEDHEIRSRKAKRVVIYTDNDKNINSSINNTNTNTSNSDPAEEVALIRYSQQSDFRRNIIKGSMRAQRRKTVTLEIFQVNVHSPLFLDRINKTFFFSSFDIYETMNIIFQNFVKRKTELKTSDFEEEIIKEKEKKEENERIAISETWDSIIFAQAIRGLMLVTQSFLRKYIVLPSLIIAKNIGRMLLLQFPEWYEDLKEWNREMHVKCTYNGVQLSETEFPKNWLTDGIQIKILFPFCLKPWRRSKSQRSKIESHHIDPMKKKGKKENFCFLTVWGMETELPFGSPRKRPSFFEPIYKELEKQIRKMKKIFFRVLKVLKEKTKWFIKKLLIIKLIIKKLEKINPIFLFELKKVQVYKTNENEKDSKENNKIINESTIQFQSTNWTNFLLIEKKMNDLADKTITIRNKIERITKEKKKIVITYDNKISESGKDIWQILKGKNTRLIRKSNYFLNSFTEKIYMDILLPIISISIYRINAKLLTKKTINKPICINEGNQEGIDERDQSTMNLISTIKNDLSNPNINNNSNIYYDLSSVSQAYVFYKLSQTQLLNKYNLKPILKYQKTYPFIKQKIKFYCMTQGIFDSQSRYKKIHKSGINEWKNWLKGHNQYNLSQTKWSQLVPKKCRNRINQYCTFQNNKDSKNLYSYKKEKDRFIHSMNENDYAIDSLTSQKPKLKKHYRYDLLSKKYINYGNNKDFIYIYKSILQANKDQEIRYNLYTLKPEFFSILESIAINDDFIKDFLEEKSIFDTHKNLDRRFFDCRILYFCLKKNINIKTWTNMHIGTKIDKNTNTEKEIKKLKKKILFFITIPQEINRPNKKKNFFDWMGMNQEKTYHTISNLEPWFFSEFVLPFDAYQTKPWVIPIKLLLLNINLYEYENLISQNQNINVNKKRNLQTSSNQKEYSKFKFKNLNQEKNEQENQGNLELDLRKQNKKKNIEEDYTRSDIKKEKKKKQTKNNKEAELNFFLKKYFLFQLRWDDPLNQRMINNIKVYCLLLRLINPKEIAISSIQRGEMHLDVMLIQKDLALTQLIKRGILIIEPLRLSIRRDGKFIIYQTINIGISLVDKRKREKDKKCIKKGYYDKKNSKKFIGQEDNNMLLNEDPDRYDFLVPEHILSPIRRRELRTLICFHCQNCNVGNENNIRNSTEILNLNEDKCFNTDLVKFSKFFLWPNYRLEDLACINRYWFDSNNGSRFSMSRIHMYPQFRIS
uniref:Protein TIC 214 n=1 Tax=Anigozanthos flavidus TaxID=72643 RepID=A0A3G2Z7L2_ANIFA|nr:hypothetical chloroplast RF 19 [Anigozanthos flavidus]AYP35533.1 hypothetical chloroplast RF 19 [Anigozanthos flavidus]